MQAMIGWSRDEKGRVTDRHIKDISNAITSFAGRCRAGEDGLGNTTPYVIQVAKIEQPTMSAILAIRRTEEGKVLRKQKEKANETIHFTDGLALMPRTDHISNTISTITKDNYLIQVYEKTTNNI